MALLPWRQLRDESLERLRASGHVDDPAQELRWIVERATGRTPSEQAAALDSPATEREVRFVDQMVHRRAGGEPLQYVLGRWGFRTLDLMVDDRVLIPRPETEVVAGLAIDEIPADGVLVDLGTGSGAIALSAAAERWPQVEVWATDVSSDALAVARANLAGLGRRAAVVRLLEGSWYDALPDSLRGRVDVIVSNPPYVAADDPLPREVAAWEPQAALVPGPTGLEAIEVIVAGAPDWLTPTGTLVVEIGETQGAAVEALARAEGFTDVRIEQDLAARDRALVARRQRLASLGVADDLDATVDEIVAVLERGGVVVLPTDTVYGLAALPTSRQAVERVFELKGRRADVPIAVLCASADQALALADPVPGVDAVAARFWPGPLTLVLPRRASVDLHLGEPEHTIGLRVPDHDLVRAVAERVGPIATTSANRHGEPTHPTAAGAGASLVDEPDLVVDGGRLEAVASTVVDASRAPWVALRDGPIAAAEVIALGIG